MTQEIHPIDDCVTIELAGRPCKLTFGFRAKVAFERKRGKSVGQMFAPLVPTEKETQAEATKRFLAWLNAEDVATLLFCMMQKHHGKEKWFSEDAVADLIQPDNIMRLLFVMQSSVIQSSAPAAPGASEVSSGPLDPPDSTPG